MTLLVETRGAGPRLLLLHGWAFGCRIWDTVFDELATGFCVSRVELPGYPRSCQGEHHSFESLVEELEAEVTDRIHILGWSLGGMLALGIAGRLPGQVGKRILVATNLRFTSCTGWPHAMQPEMLSRFRDSLMTDAGATLNRFAALVTQGSANAAAELRYLRQLMREQGTPDGTALDDGLGILQRIDLRAVEHTANDQALFIFGENDALVPSAVADDIRQAMPDAHITLIGNAGHAPFLSQTQRFVDAVRGFLS